jgi:hypothetical protein
MNDRKVDRFDDRPDMFKPLSYAPHKTFEIWPKQAGIFVLIIRHFSNHDMLWESNYFHFPSRKLAEDAILLVKLST